MSWKLEEIAEAVGGELIHAPDQEVEVTKVDTNSKEVKPGSIFVPIIAERDGHDFLESAIEEGAVASFWSQDADDAPAGFPLILVEDTEKALDAFAKYHVQKAAPKVVGITGSNGKTTTKDMTEAVLRRKYKTHKTPGNENNQLGVPRTILSMPEDTEILILEMGMSAPGEISVLSELGEPDVAVVTMIGESHIQAFGSREKLAQEKLDILVGLKEGGLFIYPNNEPLITEQFDHDIRHQSFGKDDQDNLYATDVVGDTRTTSFSVVQDGKDLTIALPVPGEYNVQNALMAILIGLEFDVEIEEAKKGLEALELTKNRLEWIDGKDDVQLLNDAYNASPTSMKAALEYFGDAEIEGERIAVLGDILELGEASKEFHESIADAIDIEKYKAVLLYGEEMSALYELLKSNDNVRHFTGEKDDLIAAIQETAGPGDAVLFKSSNGTGLLAVVDKLRKEEN